MDMHLVAACIVWQVFVNTHFISSDLTDTLHFSVTNESSTKGIHYVNSGSNTELKCEVRSGFDWRMRIDSETNGTLTSTVTTRDISYVIRDFGCGNAGKYSCMAGHGTENDLINSVYLTMVTCPPRLCPGVKASQTVKATLGSKAKISFCVIGIDEHYELLVNEVQVQSRQNQRYNFTFESRSPLHKDVTLTLLDIVSTDSDQNVVSLRDTRTVSTVFNYTFYVQIEENDDVIHYYWMLSVPLVIIIVLIVIWRYKKAIPSGRYRVRPRLSTLSSSDTNDHYEKLEDPEISRYEAIHDYSRADHMDTSVERDSFTYSSLTNDVRPFDDPYITPFDAYQLGSVGKNPAPCDKISHSFRQRLATPSSPQTVKIQLPDKRAPDVAFAREDSTYDNNSPTWQKGCYVFMPCEEDCGVYEGNFINNPAYDETIVGQDDLTFDVSASNGQELNQSSLLEELEVVMTSIDYSIHLLDNVERTLTRTERKMVKEPKLSGDNFLAKLEAGSPTTGNYESTVVTDQDSVTNDVTTISMSPESRSVSSDTDYSKALTLNANTGILQSYHSLPSRIKQDKVKKSFKDKRKEFEKLAKLNYKAYYILDCSVEYSGTDSLDNFSDKPSKFSTDLHEDEYLVRSQEDQQLADGANLSPTQAMVNYFHQRIEDDEFSAMFELMNYVQSTHK